MRCMSCGADIPPQWVHAIATNTCAGCGGEIMNSATQGLLQELTEAMQRMPNDPQGVAGWLLSNYRFQKVGKAEPVDKFHRKNASQQSVDESNLKIDDSYNEFFKRNNASKLVSRGEKLSKLKHSGNPLSELASMIQNTDPYGDDTSTLSEDNSIVDMDEKKAYLELKAQGIDPFAQNYVGGITDVSKSIDPEDISSLINQDEAPLQEEVLLSQSKEGKAFLQRNRFKKLKGQEAVTGGGGGVFRR